MIVTIHRYRIYRRHISLKKDWRQEQLSALLDIDWIILFLIVSTLIVESQLYHTSLCQCQGLLIFLPVSFVSFKVFEVDSAPSDSCRSDSFFFFGKCNLQY